MYEPLWLLVKVTWRAGKLPQDWQFDLSAKTTIEWDIEARWTAIVKSEPASVWVSFEWHPLAGITVLVEKDIPENLLQGDAGFDTTWPPKLITLLGDSVRNHCRSCDCIRAACS